MRIAVVSSYFPNSREPQRGHSTYQTLRRMTPHANIRVFVPMMAYPAWAQPRTYRAPASLEVDAPSDVAADYVALPMFPVVGRVWSGWLLSRRLRELVRAFAPDVVLNYWLYPDGWAGLLLARASGVPFIAGSIGSDLRLVGDPLTEWFIRRTVREADAVLTVSAELGAQAVARGAPRERVRPIVNGCNLDLFHPAGRAEARAELGVAPDAELVLYTGNLIEIKGLRELARAFLALRVRRPRAHLVLAGQGPLEKEISSLLTGASVQLLGQIPAGLLSRWLAACNVFCLPSYTEGCPNVVVEALASGRPVVASRVGGIPELVDARNGILVPPREVPALTEALDSALGRKWDPAVLAWRRTWDDVARETLDLCREVIAAPRYRA